MLRHKVIGWTHWFFSHFWFFHSFFHNIYNLVYCYFPLPLRLSKDASLSYSWPQTYSSPLPTTASNGLWGFVERNITKNERKSAKGSCGHEVGERKRPERKIMWTESSKALKKAKFLKGWLYYYIINMQNLYWCWLLMTPPLLKANTS